MATTVEKSTAVNQEYPAEKYADEPHVLENFFVDPKIERRLLRKVSPPSLPISQSHSFPPHKEG